MDIFKNIVVSDICDILTVYSQKGQREKIKNRKNYGLSFCIDGQITYTYNGKNYISDRNHAILLPKDKNYTLYRNKTGTFPLINFECFNFSCDAHVLIPIKDLTPYLSDYNQMKSLSIFENNRKKIISIFYNILHGLSLENNIIPNILIPAIKYLEEHFSDYNLTNTLLAKKCNISEVYFRQLFAEYYKTTPKQFIINIRINKAKQLLTDGIFKISSIAQMCGFSNPYHFCRVFKQLTGLTPTEYSKQNRIYKI